MESEDPLQYWLRLRELHTEQLCDHSHVASETMTNRCGAAVGRVERGSFFALREALLLMTWKVR